MFIDENEWIKKLWCIYIYDVILFSHKEILPFVTVWMELEGIVLSEVKERQILYDFTNMWNLIKTNKQTKSYQTHRKGTQNCD